MSILECWCPTPRAVKSRAGKSNLQRFGSSARSGAGWWAVAEHPVAAWRMFLAGVLLMAAAVVQAVETAWREVWK